MLDHELANEIGLVVFVAESEATGADAGARIVALRDVRLRRLGLSVRAQFGDDVGGHRINGER